MRQDTHTLSDTSPRHGTRKADRPLFGGFIADETTAGLVRTAVAEKGWDTTALKSGTIAAAVRGLAAGARPRFLMVDLTGSQDPRNDVQALADVCDQETVVVALGTVNDVGLYRDLNASGVHDYLVKPVTQQQLHWVLDDVDAVLTVACGDKDTGTPLDGPVSSTGFIGVRGGIGASTLVANMGWTLAMRGVDTALVDFDLVFGTLALQFDLEPGRGLLDALENPHRIDGLFLERAMVKPHNRLSILGTEAAPGMPQNDTPHRTTDGAQQDVEAHLIDRLGERYGAVLADIPREAAIRRPDLLARMTDIVLVADFSVAAARDCIRLKAFLKTAAPDVNIHLMISMAGCMAGDVSRRDFETSVELPVSAVIPYDPKGFQIAVQKDKPVVEAAPRSKASRAILAWTESSFGLTRQSKASALRWLRPDALQKVRKRDPRQQAHPLSQDRDDNGPMAGPARQQAGGTA